jgi:Domain of unknown function (DUF1707)
MANNHGMRASDQDRDAVVAVLRDAFTAGRITLEEFDERTSSAYASKTWGELRALTADLPVKPHLGADLPSRPASASTLPPAPQLDIVRVLPPGRRRRGAGPLVPVAGLLLFIGIGTGSPAAVGIAFMLFLLVLALEFAGGWHDGGKRDVR